MDTRVLERRGFGFLTLSMELPSTKEGTSWGRETWGEMIMYSKLSILSLREECLVGFGIYECKKEMWTMNHEKVVEAWEWRGSCPTPTPVVVYWMKQKTVWRISTGKAERKRETAEKENLSFHKPEEKSAWAKALLTGIRFCHGFKLRTRLNIVCWEILGMGVAKANVGMSERGAWGKCECEQLFQGTWEWEETELEWKPPKWEKRCFFQRWERERKKRRGSALLDLSYFALQPKWKLSGN